MLYDHYFAQPIIYQVSESPENTVHRESGSETVESNPSIAVEPEKKKRDANPEKRRNDAVCQNLSMEYMINRQQAENALMAQRQGAVVQEPFSYDTSMRNARQAYAKMINLGCKVPEY